MKEILNSNPSASPCIINIGTPENPVQVSEVLLHPGTDRGKEEWEMVANGSIILPDGALDKLLQMTKDENK